MQSKLELEQLMEENKMLKEQLNKDSFTGLYNKSFIDRRLKELNGKNIAIIMCDIDTFKKVNDVYGHTVGDEVIKMVVNNLRKTDTITPLEIGRFGGEEFIILCQNTNAEQAYRVAERIRRSIESSTCNGVKVTMSFGIAESSSDDCSLIKTVSQADKALYHAKNNGRNRIEIYKEKVALEATN